MALAARTWVFAVFIGVSAGFGIWAAVIEPDMLRVRFVEVASNTRPATMPPMKIAGIADDTTRTPEIVRTVAPLPIGEPILLMIHDPAVFEDATDRVTLTLAGHTHGGQVYLPGIGALIVPGRAPRRHAMG